MKIKTQKLILHFLKEYEKQYNSNDTKRAFFEDYFSKDELIEIIRHIYGDSCFINDENAEFSEKELFSLIKHDSFFLTYLIEKLEMELAAFPSFSQKEVDAVFAESGLETHYLANKQVEEWDEYDRSNYRTIMRKHGFTKKVYGIFLSEVEEDDKYLVSTKPSQFFDTLEEAEKELNTLLTERKFKVGELKILLLWKLNK